MKWVRDMYYKSLFFLQEDNKISSSFFFKKKISIELEIVLKQNIKNPRDTENKKDRETREEDLLKSYLSYSK